MGPPGAVPTGEIATDVAQDDVVGGEIDDQEDDGGEEVKPRRATTSFIVNPVQLARRAMRRAGVPYLICWIYFGDTIL